MADIKLVNEGGVIFAKDVDTGDTVPIEFDESIHQSVRTEKLSNDILYVGDRDPQTVLDEASSNATIIGDPTIQHTVTAPITSSLNGLTVRGLNLYLDDGVDDDTLWMKGDNVTVENCIIDGNKANNTRGTSEGSCLKFTGLSPTVCGNLVKNACRHNIYFEGESSGHDPSGLVAYGNRCKNPQRSNLSVEGAAIEGGSVGLNRCSGSVDTTGIEVQDGAQYVIVQQNQCWDNDGSSGVGIQFADHGSNANQWLSMIGNSVWSNRKGLSVSGDVAGTSSENFVVGFNTVINNSHIGISIISGEDNVDYWTCVGNISRGNSTDNFYNGSGATNYEAGLNLGFTVS